MQLEAPGGGKVSGKVDKSVSTPSSAASTSRSEGPAVPAVRAQLSMLLLEAVRRGDAEAARARLLEGAPADVCDTHGWAPLHYSSSSGQVEVCRLLLQFRGDANAALPDFSTPLMLAVDEAHMAVAKVLLQEGALTHCKDEDGFTAQSRCDPQVQEEFRLLTSGLESAALDEVVG